MFFLSEKKGITPIGIVIFLFFFAFLFLPNNALASVPVHCSDLDYNCWKEGRPKGWGSGNASSNAGSGNNSSAFGSNQGSENAAPGTGSQKNDPDQRAEAYKALQKLTQVMKDWTKKNAKYDPNGRPDDDHAPGPVVDWELQPLEIVARRADEFIKNFKLNTGLPSDLVLYVGNKLLDSIDVKTGLGTVKEIEDATGPTNWKDYYTGGPGDWGDFMKAASPHYNEYGLTVLASDESLFQQSSSYEAYMTNVGINKGFEGEQNVTTKVIGSDTYENSYLDVITRGDVLGRQQEFVFEQNPVDIQNSRELSDIQGLDEDSWQIKKVQPLQFGELDPGF